MFLNSVFLPLAITRGTGADDRIGNIIQVSGYYMRLTYQGVSQSDVQYFRVIIYTPKQDMLTTEVPGSDMVNIPDPRRFVIWADRTVLCPNAPGNGQGVMVLKKKFKPYLKVEYDSSLLTDITRGQILMQVLATTNDAVRISFDLRMYFRDV